MKIFIILLMLLFTFGVLSAYKYYKTNRGFYVLCALIFFFAIMLILFFRNYVLIFIGSLFPPKPYFPDSMN